MKTHHGYAEISRGGSSGDQSGSEVGSGSLVPSKLGRESALLVVDELFEERHNQAPRQVSTPLWHPLRDGAIQTLS